jgi:hypothetical protein
MVNPASVTPQVSRAIRKIVWPVLRKHGFLGATSRSAWRSRDDTIDVVNFQAAVSSGGDPLFLGQDTDASLGSFSVNLGTYYSVRRLLPWTSRSVLSDSDRPPEYSCDERHRLQTSRAQAAAYPDTVWEVSLSAPESPARAVEDALSSIQAQGIPWFEQNADLERAMAKLGAVCWLWARNATREPDKFFRSEDLFAALARKPLIGSVMARA